MLKCGYDGCNRLPHRKLLQQAEADLDQLNELERRVAPGTCGKYQHEARAFQVECVVVNCLWIPLDSNDGIARLPG
jgi:hypothetical protein